MVSIFQFICLKERMKTLFKVVFFYITLTSIGSLANFNPNAGSTSVRTLTPQERTEVRDYLMTIAKRREIFFS